MILADLVAHACTHTHYAKCTRRNQHCSHRSSSSSWQRHASSHLSNWDAATTSMPSSSGKGGAKMAVGARVQALQVSHQGPFDGAPLPPTRVPRHQPGAPPTGGMWMWTEAHVGDPSQRAQGMGGYSYRPTVGCGSPHDAVGIGTHNHRPTRDAGAAPTRGPHNMSFRRHTEHRTEAHARVCRRWQQTKPSSSPPPRPARWICCQHAA